jgi:hypothetical protein
MVGTRRFPTAANTNLRPRSHKQRLP